MEEHNIKRHSKLQKEEVLKYTKFFFVWLTIMVLAITGFILLYNYDNVLKINIDSNQATYENGVFEIKDADILKGVSPLCEWNTYLDCGSYEEYLTRQDSKVINIVKSNDTYIAKGLNQTITYVLRIKNSTNNNNLLLTLLIPAINSANWIYVDGKYVQGVGDIGENYSEYAVNQTLNLSVKDSCEIVIIAENRTNTVGGLFRAPLLSKMSNIKGLVNDHIITTVLFLIYGIIVAVLGIWVFVASKDKVYMWFSLATLAYCISISESMFRAIGTKLILAKEIIFSLSYVMMGLYLVLLCSSLISRGRGAKIAQYIAIGFNLLSILFVFFVAPFTIKADRFIYAYINVVSFTNMLYLWGHAMAAYFRTGKKFLMFTTVSVVIAGMIFQGCVTRSYISLYTFSPRNWCFTFIVMAISVNVFRQLYIISKRGVQYNENITNEVVKRTQKIESLLQERKEFTSMVAHDLKAPLASVKMMLSEVDAPKLSIDKMDKLINAIDLKVMSMTENLTTLQNFNAIDMKHEEYQKVEIGEFLEKIYNFILPDANAEGIMLRFHKMRRKIMVNVPVKKLTKAFENIIYNAISFCEEDDDIDIKYRQVGEMVEISVLDTGCGIAPQSLPHIFDKFYSDRSTTNMEKATFKGDGLGLYFVKILTQEIGGGVVANSWLNEGTEIKVSIPIIEEKLSDVN